MSRRWMLIALMILGSAPVSMAADAVPVSLALSPIVPQAPATLGPPTTLGPIEPAPLAISTPASVHVSQTQLTATPEMWLYEQEWRRYEDPKLAVRLKAEQRAGARAGRLTAMKWFGLSNQRPSGAPVPFMVNTASPSWTGNSSDPNRWIGSGR